MKRFANLIAALFLGLGCLCVFVATPAAADETTPLPPALQAAVQSGDGNAVQRIIASLAGDNRIEAAALAAQAVHAAESMFLVNPKGAIKVAQATVTVIQALPVQQASPTQSEDVITTAARLFLTPLARQVDPEGTANLAVSSIQAASTTGNATLAAGVAAQAVSVAEKMLASGDAAAAVQIAGMAMQSVKQTAVMSGAPQQALQTAISAARIVITPEAQAANPSGAAAISVAVVQVATNSAVYQVAPQSAITALAQSYATLNTPAVISAAPTSLDTAKQVLVAAQTAPALN